MKRISFLTCCVLSTAFLPVASASMCLSKDVTQIDRVLFGCGCGGGGGEQTQEIPPDKKQ